MPESNTVLRLNKFVAKSGVCNRKEAVDLIKNGSITVNGEIFREPFYEVKSTDVVGFKGKILIPEKKYVYILLNKPKDVGYEKNENERKPNISNLLKKLTYEKVTQVFPLDDSSSGLTILTNDQELINKYTDSVKKSKTVFEIQVDKPIESVDLKVIASQNSEGAVVISGIANIEGKSGNFFGIEMLNGTDSDIKQLLAAMGYHILKIDRTFINGLTKKDLKRGWSRLLTSQEVIFLKFF